MPSREQLAVRANEAREDAVSERELARKIHRGVIGGIGLRVLTHDVPEFFTSGRPSLGTGIVCALGAAVALLAEREAFGMHREAQAIESLLDQEDEYIQDNSVQLEIAAP